MKGKDYADFVFHTMNLPLNNDQRRELIEYLETWEHNGEDIEFAERLIEGLKEAIECDQQG